MGSSLRAQAFKALLRHRHLLKLRWRRPVIDDRTDLVELRRSADRSAARFGGRTEGVEVLPLTIGAMAAEWVRPPGAGRHGVLLYCHGGGYVMGSLDSHRAVVAKFARATGLSALHFEYRLAPEHPFPAAVDDARAAWRWLLGQGVDPRDCVWLGDSAGGGLCLATLLAVRDAGEPLPAAAATLSAWTNLGCDSPSYQRPDPVAPPGSWEVFARHYAGTADRRTPGVSPLFGRLAGLPPLLLCVGTDEVLLDDSTRFVDKARSAGVPAQLLLGPEMVHCYPAFAPLFPEATQAFGEVCRFLRAALPARDRAGPT